MASDLRSTVARTLLACALLTACGGAEPARTDDAAASLVAASAPAFSAQESEGGQAATVASDPGARYYVLQRGGTAARPTLLTKRIGRSVVSYSLREFDCAGRRVRYLGTGDTRRAAETGRPDPGLAPIVEGAIPDYLIGYACRP